VVNALGGIIFLAISNKLVNDAYKHAKQRAVAGSVGVRWRTLDEAIAMLSSHLLDVACHGPASAWSLSATYWQHRTIVEA